jgi:nickel/cobalt transporter (NicO) family protein
MRAWLVALLFGFIAIHATHAADPLRGGRAPAPAVSEPAPSGLLAPLARWQRELNSSISAAFRQVRETGSFAAFASILGIAFLYGVLHAAGPGHGKMVVAAYLTARRDRWLTGIGVGGLISLIQGVCAVLGVGLLAWALRLTHRQVMDHSAVVELVSYLLIALIGAVMFWRAATNRHHEGHHHGPVGTHGHDHDHHHHGHDHHHHHHDHAPQKQDWRFIVAAGLTPCASAVIIMLFALANDAFWLGALAVAALSLGMGGTVAIIGVATVLARDLARKLFATGGARGELVERVMLMLGSFLLLLFGGVLALGAWARM